MTDGIPIEIDLIECLGTEGVVPVPIMLKVGGTHAWVAASRLVREGVAEVWVQGEGSERRLEAWELEAVVRNRVQQSTEWTPGDASLSLRSTELTRTAYRERFGAWYSEKYGRRSDGG